MSDFVSEYRNSPDNLPNNGSCGGQLAKFLVKAGLGAAVVGIPAAVYAPTNEAAIGAAIAGAVAGPLLGPTLRGLGVLGKIVFQDEQYYADHGWVTKAQKQANRELERQIEERQKRR